MDKNWKRFERRVAQKTGGWRVPVADRESPLDVGHPYLGIECKYRQKFPAIIRDGYAQAVAGSDGLIPLLALGEYKNSLILGVVNIDDLVKLLSHLCEVSNESAFL